MSSELIEWLQQRGGAVIRYRTTNELLDEPEPALLKVLQRELLLTPEIRRWLENVGNGPIHASVDIAAENAMGKLLELGLHAGIPEFDEKMLPFVEHIVKHPADALFLSPFLVRGGYWHEEPVKHWFLQRLRKIHTFALHCDYDLFLTTKKAASVPTAWRGKPIYRPELTLSAAEGYTVLPTCYDWYAMAYYPQNDREIHRMIATVAAYASNPRFQAITNGYFWDEERRRCWSGGSAFVACANMNRLVLFVEGAAGIASTYTTEWFARAMSMLEGYRTPHGTYLFPAEFLKERSDSYYLYTGSHMGLTENRRKALAFELESTFRMLVIQRRMMLCRRLICVPNQVS